MTKVLLIWEVIPEDTYLFLLEGGAAEKALKAHKHFVNTASSNDAAEWLNMYLVHIKNLEFEEPISIEMQTKIVLSGLVM